MLDVKELNSMDAKALETKVSELRKELFNLRLQKTTASVEKPHQMKEVKRDIARSLTALNMKRKES